MQLSEHKTDYIVFKADAFDDYTIINCAIVKISNIADALINAHTAVDLMKPIKDFWSIDFWNSAPDFFYLDPDEHGWLDELDENKTWSFLDILEEELDELLSRQEIHTESGLLTIDDSQKLRFIAYAKHSRVEIATEHFTLEQLGILT